MNKKLQNLFETHFGEKVTRTAPVNADGSNRKLNPIHRDRHTAIGVENHDLAENTAFVAFSRHFHKSGLPVPEIYSENLAENIYLEEDLGDTTLFDQLAVTRDEHTAFPEKTQRIYEKVVRTLPSFQIQAGNSLDYRVCYPRAMFDEQSIMWDLNYFKYYFLKLGQIHFNEQKLEDDFQNFTEFLLQADRDYFLYRDFQSRNIMIRQGEPYFIDYQGGRKGALQYDIASLLFDAKADIPSPVRDQLLQSYLTAVNELISLDRESFMKFYYGYVLIRIMQAMGAYGFRGFYERKSHFLQSVPFAIRNLESVMRTGELPVELPTMTDCFQRIVQSTRLRELGDVKLPVTVRIQSFSYKHGLPQDETGHGGGFIFDCRCLPNPGRLKKYKRQSGLDNGVTAFLEKESEVHSFLTRVRDLISQVVENYQNRNFSQLTVSFGCTGGQHRSVFCAERLAEFLRKKYQANVEISHLAKPLWPKK
ncbi:MAG: phosphotransferase [bacterium]